MQVPTVPTAYAKVPTAEKGAGDAIPTAVVKRAERAGKAGWDVWITYRVRKGHAQALTRLRRGEVRASTWHNDGKAGKAYRLDGEGHVHRLSFPELDALIRSGA